MPKEKAPIETDNRHEGSESGIVRVTYANGHKHYYDIDADGDRHHISEDDVLAAYEHKPRQGDEWDADLESPKSIEEHKRFTNIYELLDRYGDDIQNARNYIELSYAPVDDGGTTLLNESFYAQEERHLKLEHIQFITKVAEKIAKEKLGLKLKSAGDEGWEEDEGQLDIVIELLQMSHKRYEAFLKTPDSAPTPPDPVDPPDPSDPVDSGKHKPAKSPDAALHDKSEGDIFWDEIAKLVDTEKDKAHHIELLEQRIDAYLNTLEVSEVLGVKEIAEKVKWGFLKIFDELTEVYGWDESTKAEKLNQYIENYTATIDPDRRDAPVDPESTNAQKKNAILVELTDIRNDLKKARDALADLKVRASSKVYVRKDLREELKAVHAKWQELHAKAGAKAMELTLFDEEDMSVKDMIAIGKTLSAEEQQALKEAQALASERGPAGGMVKRFLRRYADSYNKAGRYKKAIMLAPAGIAAGVGVGAALGFVGGGLFAGLMARGMVRGALTGKLQTLKEKGTKDADFDSLDLLEIDFDEVDRKVAAEMIAVRAAGLGKWASEQEVEDNLSKNRKSVGKAAAIGAIVGAASGIVANWAMDQHLGRGGGAAEKISGKKVPGIGEKERLNIRIPTNPLGGQGGPSGTGGIDPALLEKIPPGTTQAHWDSMDRLFNSPGKWPFSRAENFFNGDGTQAMKWLEESVRRTPGAEWHGSGTGRWISVIDPETGQVVSDTDTVWRVLVNSALTPPTS